jgi:hypothetical protein
VFTGFWLEGLKVRDHWEDLGVGGRITGPVAGFCEHGDEPFEFHKESRLLLDKLSNNQLFKYSSAPRSE